MAPRYDLDDTAAAIRFGAEWLFADGTRLPVIAGAADDGDDEPEGDAEPETSEDAGRVGELLALVADDEQRAALTADELAAVESELLTLFQEARAERTEEARDRAERIVVAIEQVREARAEADEEAARTEGEFAELASRLGLDDEADSDTPPDPEPENEPEPAAEDEPEPVLAAARPPAGPSRLPRRATVPAQPRRNPVVEIRAQASLLDANRRGNIRPTNTRQIMDAMIDAHRGISRVQLGASVKVPVARVTWDYPDERDLRSEASVHANTQKLERTLGFPALQASGGLCGPLNVDYGVVSVASDERPVRDGLPRFGADRGGVTYNTPPSLSQIIVDDTGGAVGVWDIETDENPGGEVKSSQHVECGEPQTAYVEAIYKQLCFGNFQARYASELTDAWVELTLAAHARFAEERLLAAMAAASTTVTRAATLGAARDVLAMLSVATVRYRHRHRIPRGVNLIWFYPEWLLDMVRDDIANSLAHEVNALDIAEAQIETWFRSRNVTPRAFVDGENTVQEMSAPQPGGGLIDYPASAVSYLHHEGAFMFLDGGQLDLGVVRDNESNATNDFCTFAESFEGLAYRGLEALRIVSTLCPNGASAGTIEPDECVAS